VTTRDVSYPSSDGRAPPCVWVQVTNAGLKSYSPYRNHLLLVRSVAHALHCFSRVLRVPVVLSGTVHADATGVLMDPPKCDLT
jgi:hypothetical protein